MVLEFADNGSAAEGAVRGLGADRVAALTGDCAASAVCGLVTPERTALEARTPQA